MRVAILAAAVAALGYAALMAPGFDLPAVGPVR